MTAPGPPSEVLCPSARCAEGARLLGVVGEDGQVAFAANDIRVDARFVAAARSCRVAESRFRFADACQHGRCAHWTGQRCGVVDIVLVDGRLPVAPAVPDCTIRDRCRWFLQAGEEACRVCPGVITQAAR